MPPTTSPSSAGGPATAAARKDVEFADERPRRKGYRPWRNRAIVYCLIETGMRRAAVCNLDLCEVDFDAEQRHRPREGRADPPLQDQQGRRQGDPGLPPRGARCRPGDVPAVPGALPAAGDGGQQLRPPDVPG